MQKEGIVSQVEFDSSYQLDKVPGVIFYVYAIMFSDGTIGKYHSKESDINKLKFKVGQSIKYEVENRTSKNGNQWTKISPVYDDSKSNYKLKEEDIKSIAMLKAITETTNLISGIKEVISINKIVTQAIFTWLLNQENRKLAGDVVKTTTLYFINGLVDISKFQSDTDFVNKWIEVSNYIYNECNPKRFIEQSPTPVPPIPVSPQQNMQQQNQYSQASSEQIVNSAFHNPNSAPSISEPPF